MATSAWCRAGRAPAPRPVRHGDRNVVITPPRPWARAAQQDVPAERVDRRAAGDRRPIEVARPSSRRATGRRRRRARRGSSSMLVERGRSACRAMTDGGRTPVDDVERRRRPTCDGSRYSSHTGCINVAELAAQRRVLDDGDPPGLAVAAATARSGRRRGCSSTVASVDRFVGELPNRAVRADGLADVHRRDLVSGVRAGCHEWR